MLFGTSAFCATMTVIVYVKQSFTYFIFYYPSSWSVSLFLTCFRCRYDSNQVVLSIWKSILTKALILQEWKTVAISPSIGNGTTR